MEQDRVETLYCNRYALEKKAPLSPEIDAILWPSSEKKAIDDSFKGPLLLLLLLSAFIQRKNP